MANIERSTEIRWFFKGAIPDEVNQWFNNHTDLGDPLTEKDSEEREDLYLVGSEAINLSPKLRQGKLEIKLFENSKEILGLNGTALGRGENWKKWKWKYLKKKGSEHKAVDHVVPLFLEATPKELRVNVWKNRRQRKFNITTEGKLEPVPMSKKDLPFGILVELAVLNVNGEQWYTIGFDVFGDPNQPMDILQQGVNWIISTDYPGPPLKIDSSYSYPEWISTLL